MAKDFSRSRVVLEDVYNGLKISEHPLIILCNHKTGYNWYSKMPTMNQHTLHSTMQGHPEKLIWGPRAKFAFGPLHVIPFSNTMIRGSGGILPGKILKSQVPKWPNSAFWKSSWQLYWCIFRFNSLLEALVNRDPRANCAPLGGLHSTSSYDYLWQHSFIITCL
jgi:hypothetical protein